MSRDVKNAFGALALAAVVAASAAGCQSKTGSAGPGVNNTSTTASAVGGSAPKTTPTTSPKTTPKTTASAPAAAKGLGGGTLIVGKDIQPGTYKAIATDTLGGYWERDKDTSGTTDSVLANDNVAQGEQAVITILPTDKAFKSSGFGGWVPAAGPSLTGGKLGGGTLIVGVDIQPGTYTATATASLGGYWEREKDTLGGTDSVLANDNVDAGAKATVTISASDKAFKSSGFGPWVKS
ncbi:hypothetical protein KGQ20_29495 [Catenulispora sp. NF23]|uniref:hypothetical protein n=1 Tax=Catenulispora pinistramenti TaxID=2705254 RepID=UPI001BA84783|nr:hypothetical protein [Catenulispora pinistramenti]MBS2536906.1 hypothetical protein [Catenulispora pinistramenti]